MPHRIKGSNFFTLLDLPSVYHQLSIKEVDRHKTAFRDARGRLYDFTQCGFGLTTIPAVLFSAHLGDTFRPVENKGGAELWLDDIPLHRATLADHLALLDKVFDLLDNVLGALQKERILHVGGGVPRSHGRGIGCAACAFQDQGRPGDGVASDRW